MRKFSKPNLNIVLSILLLLGIAFSVITIVNSAAPNPGHLFTESSGNIATGDLIYGSAPNVFSALADVAAGSYLRSGGVSLAPLWSTLTLPNAATTGDILYATGANTIGNLVDVATGRVLISGGTGLVPSYSTTPTLGAAGTLGTLSLAGNTSGVITIQPQAAAGTYNFNLPINVGTTGQPLLSGGGGATAMTFGTLGVGAGGTGLAATADDAVFVGDSASAVTARTLPTCSAATTDKLLYNISTNTFSCGVDQTGGGSTMTTVITRPASGLGTGANAAVALASLTVYKVGLFNIPYSITVNQLAYNVGAVTTAGSYRICVYNEAGTTISINVTDVPTAGVNTVAVGAVALSPGNYYIAMGCATTCSNTIFMFTSVANTMINTSAVPTGKKRYEGTVTMTSGTCNATLPAITGVISSTAVVRLDN